ncbi:MAG: hypothetical protein MJZ72_09540 [Bacteroidales bacterium]|nr:hypothetical protein [Bacteroidales bacterium]
MSDRTDPAWDEYLSTGEDPTGGALEEADEEIVSDEVVPGEWQQYSKPAMNKPHVRKAFTMVGFEQFFDVLEVLVVIIFLLACVGTCS